jgi:hypothetical protein
MSTQIYTGSWTDWSRGRVLGATLTLSSGDGKFLVAFLAFFVTMVGARTWRLVGFTAHQSMAKDGAHDGIHYQRQHILRNTGTPTEAAWQFLEQAWFWRKSVQKAWLRTLPWAAFAALYLGLFAAASILSASVSDGASEYRLLKSAANCGLFIPTTPEALQVLGAFENQQAATYTRQCYDDDAASDACNHLPVRSISWRNESTSCPFNSTVCLPNTPAFRMSTDMLDSHHDFGINDLPQNRIGYRRETTCSPLVTRDLESNTSFIQQFVSVRDGEAYNATIHFRYGRLTGPLGQRTTYTYSYNTDNFEGNMGYSVWPLRHYPERVELERSSTWVPISALEPNASDITILFVVHNSIMHLEQNNDPVFAAHYENYDRSRLLYMTDRPVSPIACIDRFSICNPNSPGYKCTPPQASGTVGSKGELDVLDLNPVQQATATRLAFLSRTKSFYDLVFTRTNNFLRAQDRVTVLTQHRLPDDQWKTEMAALFQDGLSLLQHQVMRYPIGPPRSGNVTVLKPWMPGPEVSAEQTLDESEPALKSALEGMCHNQKVRITDGTLNFSILGLGLLLGFGSLLIILSFVTQPAVACVQKKTGIGAVKAGHWERDDSLQVMRVLFEARGAGDWEGTMADFPRTKTACTFEYGTGNHQPESAPTQGPGEEASQMADARPGIRRKPVAVVSAAGV